MKQLEENLKYEFINKNFLENALTHSSYANEKHTPYGSNERLEFLGDAVLSIVVADYLYHTFKNIAEGELTKLRASLVCEKALCGFAKELNLGEYLKLGRGEKSMGGAERPSILADAFEAVLAAMYLDGGMEVARKHIMRFILPELERRDDENFKDYKTALQEIIQQNHDERLCYVLVEEKGPDHDKDFTVEVHLNSNPIGVGTAKTKKHAEQIAAKQALELMGIDV